MIEINGLALQEAPVLVAANHEQKKKFLGRMTEEPIVAVSPLSLFSLSPHPSHLSPSPHTLSGLYHIFYCIYMKYIRGCVCNVFKYLSVKRHIVSRNQDVDLM